MTKANTGLDKNRSPADDKNEPTARHEADPRSELGLKSPVPEAKESSDNPGAKATEKPSQQDPEKGNEMDPRLKEPYGPAGYRSGLEDPDEPSKQNPGQVNPGHNTPGHARRDQPGQQDIGKPGQGKTQSYPGIMGSKARALREDEKINEEEVKVEPGKT